MIDEDLYKIATDELNSDDRKPEVWARACALASDDHDEARFLYTNLRVEEMLNKDGKQRTFSTNEQHRNANSSSTSQSESLDFESVAPSNSEPLESVGLNFEGKVAPIEANITNADSLKSPPPDNELDTIEFGDLDAPTSASDTGTLSDKVVEFDDETMAELAELSNENATDTDSGSNMAGKPGNTSQFNKSTVDTGDVVTSVFRTPAAANHEPVLSQSQDQELAQTIEPEAAKNGDRQPQPTDVDVTEIKTDAMPNPTNHDATAETAHANSAARATNTNAVSAQGQNSSQDTTITYSDTDQLSDTDQVISDDDTMGVTSELDIGLGRSFMVFNQYGTLKAVKRGVSWPALLFTFPWLLSKALFGTAIVYGCLWLVSLGGLFFSANRWLNVGADASINLKLWTGAFALLTIIGLLYIPFRYGNRWVAEKLQHRGFRYEGSVSAENRHEAIDRLMQYNHENSK